MSMVLRDQGFTKMTHEEWAAVVDPKVQGTWNLHNASVARGLELDLFLLFGSISGIFGQRGQANYAAANTFLDAFVEYRRGLGLKAAAVDVGMMLDHGYVAENERLRERLISQGNYGIRTPELLDALTAAVIAAPAPTKTKRPGTVQPFVNLSQLIVGVRRLTPLSDSSNRVIWKADRRTVVYANSRTSSGEAGTSFTSSADASILRAFVASANANPDILSSDDTAPFIARQIALQLFRLLLRPVEDDAEIDLKLALQDIGLDSLVAVEMRSWLKSTFGLDIRVLEMLGMASILALGERVIEGLRERLEGSIARDMS